MVLLFQWLKNYLIINRYNIGLFFALFIAIGSVTVYKFYIKNYYFVIPSSNELLGLSVIAFLISLYMIYKRYFVEQNIAVMTDNKLSVIESFTSKNISLYAKVPYIIALVVGIVALIEAIAGETLLYPKSYGTKALENIILVSALCCLHLYWLKINLYRNFYTHIITNKLEVVIYILLTIPYIIFVVIFIPGGRDFADNMDETAQALGVQSLANWHPAFITFLIRLFHFFPYEAGLYIFQAFCLYIPIVYIFAQMFKKQYIRYIIYCLLLYCSVFNYALFMMLKDSEATLFTFIGVLILVLYLKNRNKKYLIISIISFALATYSRHNQITQIIILLIPSTMLAFKLRLLSRNDFVKLLISIVLILGVIQIPNVLLFKNKNLITYLPTVSNFIGTSIAYIAFRQENLTLLPEELRNDSVTINHYKYYLEIKNNKNISNVWSLYLIDSNGNWGGLIKSNDISYLLKLSIKYPYTALEHIYIVFTNFMNTKNDFWIISDKADNLIASTKLRGIEDKAKFASPFFNINIYHKLVAINMLGNSIKYKYIFYTYVSLLIMTFIMLGCKIIPNINYSNKNMTLIYYMTLSNICLIIPLSILTAVGMENRYLLASYPLTGLSVLLFLQELPRYLRYYNRCITRFTKEQLVNL